MPAKREMAFSIHPCPDEQGRPVRLTTPSTPTPLAAWSDSGALVVVTPAGKVPKMLNGISMASWDDAPQNASGWEQVACVSAIEEPAFTPPPGKRPGAGVVVLETDGRIWCVAPSNAFGGYRATLPKGQRDAMMSLQACALREAFEEAGLQLSLLDHLVDVSRSTSFVRYYLARRLGGNPGDMGWESQAVMLVPPALLAKILHHRNDALILDALLARGFLPVK